jgi:aminopeptidase YwaD
MYIKRFIPVLVLLVLANLVVAQVQYSFEPQKVKERLKKDVIILSSDEFEGREAGTPGEKKAAEFIELRMQEIGLQPMFGDSWVQTFTFPGGWILEQNNFLVIGEEEFAVTREYLVLTASASDKVTAKGIYVGYGVEDETQNDYSTLTGLEGKIFIMEYYLPSQMDDGNQRSFSNQEKKITTAKEKGAAGVIFVNSSSERRDPTISLNQRQVKQTIPVVFAKSPVFEFWQQNSEDQYITLSTDLSREIFTSYNVAGYIDNQAETTVVIGGHFDHVGYGGSGSRSPGVRAIHPGADDNASGTAGVLEAARYLQQSNLTSSNYIFVAFGAEEKGLIGSRYFVESNIYDWSKVNFMLNLDMIGRLENNNLSIMGTGTSPVWETVIDANARHLNIRKGSSGVGGSDHTNFYRKNIPVLFFFTGLHDDYHRPGDTEDKINYTGMYDVMTLAYDIISSLDGRARLEFTETAAPSRTASTGRSGITLGVMPDHAFDGSGMRIQGVSPDRPAQKAGMKDGDIIIRIKDQRVTDIESYMRATQALRESETVRVRILRSGREMDLDVKL